MRGYKVRNSHNSQTSVQDRALLSYLVVLHPSGGINEDDIKLIVAG